MRIGLGFLISSMLACSSSNPDVSVDSGHDASTDTSASDSALDSRPVDDGAIPPKCPTFHAVKCGSATCAVGSICSVTTSAPSDAGEDATPDAAVPDSVDGKCVAAPAECLTNCPSTDCVCVAWLLAKDCAIDSTASCRTAGDGIVPVVYCSK